MHKVMRACCEQKQNEESNEKVSEDCLIEVLVLQCIAGLNRIS
jgi:hypothetical protein